MFGDVAQFNNKIRGVGRPLAPIKLTAQAKTDAITFLSEELKEFIDANNLADEADALIDLSYFALGRLHEMGVDANALFKEVHRANMAKVRGKKNTRPGISGHDAIKPEGWIGPNVDGVLADQRKPKLLVIGHARHGKDTFCEHLRDNYGFNFISSSLYCAERVIWRLINDWALSEGFLLSVDPAKASIFRDVLDYMRLEYLDVQQCFEDRSNYREFWYKAIAWHCQKNPALIGEEILRDNDIYCGVRSVTEFNAIKEMVDLVVWVDGSQRLPLEPSTSMALDASMADVTIDNNADLNQFLQNVDDLVRKGLTNEEWVVQRDLPRLVVSSESWNKAA